VGFTTETSFDNFQSCCASWAALLRHFCLDMGDQREDIILVTKSVLAAPRKRMATMVQIQVMVTLTMVLGGPVRGGKVYGTHGGLSFCVQGSVSRPLLRHADSTPLWVGKRYDLTRGRDFRPPDLAQR